MQNQNFQEISKIVELYFLGTYHGDASKLRQAFHPDAHITGCFKGQYIDWTLDDFIARTTQKPAAVDKNEILDKKIILIDLQNNAAIVKATVLAGGIKFTDYITLLQINNQWIIRNKSFTTEE